MFFEVILRSAISVQNE